MTHSFYTSKNELRKKRIKEQLVIFNSYLDIMKQELSKQTDKDKIKLYKDKVKVATEQLKKLEELIK